MRTPIIFAMCFIIFILSGCVAKDNLSSKTIDAWCEEHKEDAFEFERGNQTSYYIAQREWDYYVRRCIYEVKD